MAKNEQMWEKTEVSTRNCYNAVNCQGAVYCRIGIYGEPGQTWSLYDGDNNGLNTQRVASRGVLFASCQNCSNFDNDW